SCAASWKRADPASFTRCADGATSSANPPHRNRDKTMSLTNRLSLFFLGALAFVLIGFSATLVVLARGYLYPQVDERFDAALSTVAAAAEIGPDGVEWEPHERQLILSQDEGNGFLSWTVRDDKGTRLPHAPRLVADDFPSHVADALAAAQDSRS